MREKINQLLSMLPIIQKTYSDDACLVLTDKERILACLPGEKIDLKLPIGIEMSKYPNSVTYKCLKTGKNLREERGAKDMGVAYISTATPILDENGEIAGALSAIISNQRLTSLRESSIEISAAVEEMAATSDEMTKASENTAQRLQILSEKSEMVTNDIKKVHDILKFVKDIATQSHMLGLNAAIEAARAGEHGRGFSVVANEIRKMAENSKNSVGEIFSQLTHMEKEVININDIIQEIAAHTEEHTASVEQFHFMIEQIAKGASELSDQAKL